MQDIELKLFVGMHRNVNALDRRTAQLAQAEHLTLAQFAVLEVLYSKGSQSISSVRDHILSSAGTIPVIVRNLQQRGLIARQADPADRRVCILSLTEEGRRIIEWVIPRNTAMIRQFFSVLSRDEQTELLRMMRKIGGINHAKND